jgi:diadenosine tetraphosphate (Ap4A) HIT family hydrolase
MNICTICEEIKGYGNVFRCKEYGNIVSKKQTVLYVTENFVILPSLGALNKSHILIIPKNHYLSFSTLPNTWDNEVKLVKQSLNEYSRRMTGRALIFFEHGAGSVQDSSGACIDHAHLHGIWDIKDFESTLLEELEMNTINHYKELHHKTDNYNGYIFFENKTKHRWISNNPDAPSQYFRYLYSKVAGLKFDWNWKVAPQIENIKNVIENYKELRKIKMLL